MWNHNKQLLRQPFYLILFFFAVLISVTIPRNSFEKITDLPFMIFFVMGFSLLFLLYGAEQARMDLKSNVPEWISTLPNHTTFYLHKVLSWFLFSFVWYVLFYSSLLLYMKYGKKINFGLFELKISLVYTLLCWFLLFFLCIMIGYTLYKWIPSIFTYISLLAIWVLVNPYNYFLGFIPSRYLAWITIGDPNFIYTAEKARLEQLMINDGAFYQRAVATILVILTFLLSTQLIRKKRIALISTILALSCIGIVLFAPSQKITEVSKIYEFTELPTENTNYQISDYHMVINHYRIDHQFSYSVDMKIKTTTKRPIFALFNDFEVNSAKSNGNSISYSRVGENLIQIELPDINDDSLTISFNVSTSKYADVNPTSFELLPTLPWYPMNPMEALDPVYQAKKENYVVKINARNKNNLISNLSTNDDGLLTGTAFGPTLLYGPFTKDSNGTIQPFDTSAAEATRQVESISFAVKEGNSKLNTNLIAPKQIYINTSHSRYTANPDESFITLSAVRFDREIFSTLFLKKLKSINDNTLFVNLVYEDNRSTSEVSAFKGLNSEKKQEILRNLYSKTFGIVTTEDLKEEINRVGRSGGK